MKKMKEVQVMVVELEWWDYLWLFPLCFILLSFYNIKKYF